MASLMAGSGRGKAGSIVAMSLVAGLGRHKAGSIVVMLLLAGTEPDQLWRARGPDGT